MIKSTPVYWPSWVLNLLWSLSNLHSALMNFTTNLSSVLNFKNTQCCFHPKRQTMEGCQKVKSVVLELSAASGNEAECASVSTLVLGRTGDRIVLIGCA
jgi:hypothetical protein